MLIFLRFVGVTNAALWLGAIIFLSFGVEPGFYAAPFKFLAPWNQAASANALLAHYYRWHFWFNGVALVHLLAERLYAGRPMKRAVLYLLIGLLGLGWLGAAWIQPHLVKANLDHYGIRSTPAQRERGQRAFGLWRGADQFVNFFVGVGVLLYLWDLAIPMGASRFTTPNKFRG